MISFLDDPWFRTRVEAESALYADILGQFSIPESIEKAACEYEEFFKNPTKGEIPRDVAYIWRIHMLHPRCYREDCKKVFGMLVVPSYKNHDFVPQLDKEYVRVVSPETRFSSMDLASGMRRQLKF